jgi:hypothetical protein
VSNAVNIPADFYFELENLARYCDKLPGNLEKSGSMCDLGPDYRIVSSSEIAGFPDFSDTRCAWSNQGLALVFDTRDLSKHIQGLVKLNIWVDTRNTRNVHRATRFCHQFRLEFDPFVTIGRKRAPHETMAPGAEPSQVRINRALADAPVANRDSIYTDLLLDGKGGFRLAIFLTHDALNGFDPNVNSLLGLAYRLQAPGQEMQRLGPGQEFPVQEDPSLWTVLDLVK